MPKLNARYNCEFQSFIPPPKLNRSIVPNDLTNLRKERKRKSEAHNMAKAMMAEGARLLL